MMGPIDGGTRPGSTQQPRHIRGMSRPNPVHPSLRSIIKRLSDLTVAALGLIFLAPVLIVIALVVYLLMGRPILFLQVRSGCRTRPFTIYKFRTMRESRRPDGSMVSDAERLTRLGQFLRKTSLDELPQLWNVIRGDLSLVGPRPQLIEYLPLYTPEQTRRHEVRPGITGWAQVNGRNTIGWVEKFRYDVWYVDHWSLWLDTRILLLTITKVILCEGINERDVATVTPFRGSTMEDGSARSSCSEPRICVAKLNDGYRDGDNRRAVLGERVTGTDRG
jgi:sugar transferase EpsL